MLDKKILTISIITASLLIWCGSSSTENDTNTSREVVADNPTIISNLKITPIVAANARSIKASSDFSVSYTVEDKDGLVDSSVHVKGEDGIEIRTKTFTFQSTQTKEDVNTTFNISETGKYSVAVKAKGIGSPEKSAKNLINLLK